MIAEKLPQKGKQNKGIVYSGLQPRPQMEQLVDYLANGQERVQFPNREAKQIRNHPFMTQVDFFDMQDEQSRAWADQVRKNEAQQAAEQEKTSEAMEREKKRKILVTLGRPFLTNKLMMTLRTLMMSKIMWVS